MGQLSRLSGDQDRSLGIAGSNDKSMNDPKKPEAGFSTCRPASGLTVLARKDVVEDRYLRLVDTPEVRTIIGLIQTKKNHLMKNRSGMSNDGEMRAIGSIPREIYFHPAFRHIFHSKDTEKNEEMKRRFLNERSAFRLVSSRV